MRAAIALAVLPSIAAADPRLRVRAARHRRSMEEEARVILRSALAGGVSSPMRLGDAIHHRFRAMGVDLEIPAREPMREPPKPR